jgi:hypothetical protein
MSDDGCGCLVALAIAGVVAYGAWTFFATHGNQPIDAVKADVRRVQPPPARVLNEQPDADDLSPPPVSDDPTQEQKSCAVISRVSVNSSEIRSVGYCRAERILEVEFVRGAIYRYWGVSQGTFEALIAAPSKGQFFNAAIRSQQYRYSRVR